LPNFSKHLLPAVVITVLLGAAIATALTAFLTWLVLKIPPTGTLPAPGPNGTSPFLDVLKVALTVAAGIGGAVALVVAYRRQRHLEVDDAGRRSRYTSAAQQLGDPQAAVRLAGVYAMAHLADEWPEQRQQCVDVLCAYLRLPWAEDPTQSEPNTTAIEQTGPEDELKVTRTYSGRAGEREVRQTLVRVIASHLRADTRSITGSSISWSDLEIDLTNAALPHSDFAGANFRGPTSFEGAAFSGPAYFDLAQFSGYAQFGEAKFSDIASFDQAKFSTGASFSEAQFSDSAIFTQSYFSATTSFGGAKFSDLAFFDYAQFSGVAFFDNVQFPDALFNDVQFLDRASFDGAQFHGRAEFERVQFSGSTTFAGASLPSRSIFASAVVAPSEEAINEAAYLDEQSISPQVPPPKP
jgi:uncharacterized protein YjbI with pentapeptide repeats